MQLNPSQIDDAISAYNTEKNKWTIKVVGDRFILAPQLLVSPVANAGENYSGTVFHDFASRPVADSYLHRLCLIAALETLNAPSS